MYPHTRNISPDPVSSDESNSSASASTPRLRFPFPSTVVLKHSNCHGGADNINSSEGTGPTFIEASPLSTEQYSHVDTLYHCDKLQPKHRLYPNRASATEKNEKGRQNVSRQHEMTHCGYSDANHIKQGNSKQNDTLTWRMEPSVSLSDFTLTVIGIDDKIAIQKYIGAKKKRKEMKKIKRRNKWMVEGLYLDMSQSEDDNDDDCRNVNDDKDHGLGQEHRSDVHIHSTLSGTKTSKYPVLEKYNLHKVNLAVGLRSCDYFSRLFRKRDASSDDSDGRSIEVPLSCLPAVPAVLDYLYDPDPTAPVRATTATAVPLRHLGAVLGNRPLFESATRFLHGDLRPETAVEYLQHAELYRQGKLADVCTRIGAESFEALKVTWFASLAPRLMKGILHSRYFTRSIDDLVVCSRIASYCRCQLHKIDRDSFLSLTSVKVMPVVSPEEALFFIQMMIRLGMDVEDRDRDGRISRKERSLYERCIDAAPVVVQGVIDSLREGDSDDVGNPGGRRGKASRRAKNACGDYSRLPPHVKVDLLEYALAQQQSRDDDIGQSYSLP